ncbi:MAG: hypothetical protein C0615_06795 [Desulfuromonas sp.]|nr:MAG: hypothetical protein C0615_06795 [Desulfuromonas sp.]
MYRLERQVDIAIDADTLWQFIATPRNLDQITPPELKFRIISDVPDQMYDGLLIRYQISIPLFGKREWLTEISDIVPGESFVDTQLEGPYKSWRHFHKLEPIGGDSSRMIDRIDYELPFGPVGALTHDLIVRRQLEEIFDYREKALREIFLLADT